MKRKMDPVKKVKLIYSGELIIIALVAIVLGTLIWFRILGTREHFPLVYTILTMIGGTWIIADFIWASLSKKRKTRISYLDKCLNLPLGLGLIAFDIYSLVTGLNIEVYQAKYIAFFFYYIALNYLFQGIYHYFYPIPGLLEIEEQDKKIEIQKEAIEASLEEKKKD